MHGHARLAIAIAAVVALASGACSLVTSWDGLAIDVAPDAGDGAVDAAPEASTPSCVAGRRYCGGDGVVGDPSSLYLCVADGGASFVLPCAHGCARRPGRDDACVCVPGSPYCGNDQIPGDGDALYECQSDYGGKLVTTCDAGCVVHASANDACR